MPWKDAGHDKWKSAKDDEEWDSSWKQDNGNDGWENRRRGKAGKKGRSRSRRKQHGGKREWRDSGQDEWKEWKQHGGDQWHQGGGSTWSGNSWKNDRWQAANQGKNEQQQQQGWQPWDQTQPLRCRVHGKNRSWDKLVEGPEGWVCREDAPCIIYVGGTSASDCDLRALLDEVKGRCDRPNSRTGGAGKVGRAFRAAPQKHSRSSKGSAAMDRSGQGSFSRSNKHSQWSDDRDSGRRHAEPRGSRRRDRQGWHGGDGGRDESRRGAGRKKRDASGSGGQTGLPPPPPPPALGMQGGALAPVMLPYGPVMGACFPQQVVPIGQKQQQAPAGATASQCVTSGIDVEDL